MRFPHRSAAGKTSQRLTDAARTFVNGATAEVPPPHGPSHTPLAPANRGGTTLRSHRYSRNANELPATLRRSCQAAQDAFTEARDGAVQAYGEGDQADKAAFTMLKKKFEKCGDHWIAK